MTNITKRKSGLLIAVTIITSLFLASCANNDPVGSSGGTSKVAGRVSSTNGLQKSTYSESTLSGVQGATVVLVQVQADGSLKTVSTQNIQTDAAGKFVIETNLSGTGNLVVVATKGTTEWKAIVSSKVQSGTTVYAPPLTTESTAETNIYIKLVSEGHASDFDEADLKLLLNAQAAGNIQGDSQAESDFIHAFQASSQASAQASGNSYFGLSSSQIQTMMQAKADAEAKFDAALYNSSDTETETENSMDDYEGTVLTAYSSGIANAYTYAELMRIGVTTFVNASASMNSDLRLAIAKSFYARYAFVLNYAMKQQFQAAGASNAQVNSVASAGADLYASIKSSADFNQIATAFVQYHSSIISQLQVTMSSYASMIDTIDSTINSTISAKAVLNASVNGTTSLNTIINAYVTFFNAVKTTTQTSLVGTSSTQVNAASQILILANMN
ncbi:MAG: hypothetical protein WCS69_00960 [Ignavibacteriaceae bacterium]|jgi:hypothetical protein